MELSEPVFVSEIVFRGTTIKLFKQDTDLGITSADLKKLLTASDMITSADDWFRSVVFANDFINHYLFDVLMNNLKKTCPDAANIHVWFNLQRKLYQQSTDVICIPSLGMQSLHKNSIDWLSIEIKSLKLRLAIAESRLTTFKLENQLTD